MERLDETDGPNQRALFVRIGESNKGVETWVDFDMIHVTPPQSAAPDFIRNKARYVTGGMMGRHR